MYAVIFRARIRQLDESYSAMAQRMRELAMSRYGCLDFTSVAENGLEVSISYWSTQEQIQQWKQDKEHLQAQQLGRERWYHSYTIQVVELLREYEGATAPQE